MSQTKAQLIDNLVQPITGALGSASAPTFSFTSDPNTGLYSPGADQLALTTGGTGRLFVNSNGDIGLSTNSPDVFGRFYARAIGISSSGSTSLQINAATGSTAIIDLGVNASRTGGITSNVTQTTISTLTATPLVFETNSGERLRITSAGLVGVGTSTPQLSIGAVGGNVLHLAGAGTTGVRVQNTSGNSIEIYAGTDGFINQSGSGVLNFQLAGSTKATLTSTGLGIGTSSPGALLHVANKIRFGSNASYYAEIDHDAGSTGANIYNSWDTGGHIFQRNGNEQLRITGAGEVGINTSSPLSKLGIAYTATGGQSDGIRLSDTTNTTVSVLGTTGSSYSYAGVTGHNTLLYGSRDLAICADNANNGIIKFMTGGAERVRIGTDGILYLGTTGTVSTILNARLQVVGSNAATFLSTGGASQQVAYFHNNATASNNLFVEFGTETSVTTRGSIDYNRAAGQTRYNVTSDRRLKSDIQPAGTALGTLSAIQVRSYKWAETGYQVDYGFIAQELNEVAPDAVKVGDDGKEVINTWAVDNGKLVPLLTKALQEAIAKIETLEARLTAAGIA